MRLLNLPRSQQPDGSAATANDDAVAQRKSWLIICRLVDSAARKNCWPFPTQRNPASSSLSLIDYRRRRLTKTRGRSMSCRQRWYACQKVHEMSTELPVRRLTGRRNQATSGGIVTRDAITRRCDMNGQQPDETETIRRSKFQRPISDVVILTVISQAILMSRCAAAAGEFKIEMHNSDDLLYDLLSRLRFMLNAWLCERYTFSYYYY